MSSEPSKVSRVSLESARWRTQRSLPRVKATMVLSGDGVGFISGTLSPAFRPTAGKSPAAADTSKIFIACIIICTFTQKNELQNYEKSNDIRKIGLHNPSTAIGRPGPAHADKSQQDRPSPDQQPAGVARTAAKQACPRSSACGDARPPTAAHTCTCRQAKYQPAKCRLAQG